MPTKQYDRDNPASYALGVYPSLALLELNPGCARKLMLDDRGIGGDGVERLMSKCALLKVGVETAPRALKRISGKDNCFAAIEFDKARACKSVDPSKPHVVLYEPSDQGNVGTILRSMAGFGLGDLVLIGSAADVFDPHTVRASMGALFACRVSAFGGDDGFERYREAFPSHAVYPFMLGAALTLNEAAASHDRLYALVFGNEGAGLPERFSSIGTPVMIPQRSTVDSLNLAVAASIAMYTFTTTD
ncbi:MAG: TrmH family RNA methyltransferase [Oscillospiraceae bacterium]|jgi:TrmH family RNA methyltransferase|nr:TrmH family RNA methyltransferase [Oscillospiraceae bacterium]